MSGWKTRIRVFLAVATLLWIPLGCGSKDGDVVKPATAPAANTTSSVTPAPVNNGQLSTSTGTGVSGGGTSPLFLASAYAYGPADGQSGQPPRVLTLGMSNALGIDQRLRVRIKCQSSPGRIDAITGTNTPVGGSSTYNTLAATLTLLINGVTYQSSEVAATNCVSPSGPNQYSNVIDFSSSVYQALAGRSAANVQIIVSNIKSDYKIYNGICYQELNICNASYTGYSIPGYCQGEFNRCISRNTPYGPISLGAGWRFSLEAETDITTRF